MSDWREVSQIDTDTKQASRGISKDQLLSVNVSSDASHTSVEDYLESLVSKTD